MQNIHCIDSHTGGEPTRVVLSGFPDLQDLPLPQAVHELRSQHDHYRRATVCEPRGSDVIVGAVLLPPRTRGALASVIFFNNVGYLGMCGHGTIGLMATLEYLGRVTPGSYALDTPVGTVQVELRGEGVVRIENVPAFRHLADVVLDVPGHGIVRGDVAWGGNWFFLCDAGALAMDLPSVEPLTERAWAIRQALSAAGVTGLDGAEIDHIELMGPAADGGHDGRNFVLCPGRAYDRSPCGTGTSAKLACLAADGKLAAGTLWRQESVLGSVFEASYRMLDGKLIPTIQGQAHVCAETHLLVDAADPYAWGIS
ncbi:MAG: proline racemase family protein [Rhodoferax sp.]|nr:proline racemase family protein [Rhodoferax sp.]HQZ06854.1 proline racemase family protein [Burkholderiaceae bacterium]